PAESALGNGEADGYAARTVEVADEHVGVGARSQIQKVDHLAQAIIEAERQGAAEQRDVEPGGWASGCGDLREQRGRVIERAAPLQVRLPEVDEHRPAVRQVHADDLEVPTARGIGGRDVVAIRV